MRTVAQRLRLAREQAGLSQGQVAKMLRKHRPTISEIEAGRRRVTAEELAEFTRIYQVSVAWLTGSEATDDELDDRVRLAARELAKLKPKDLDTVLRLLATMRQEGLRNVKIAVINNGYLGMVRQWQELFNQRRYSGTPLSGPDFAQLAEAHGIRGTTVTHAESAAAAIDAAWRHDGCALVDFRVEREANVFPMVPQGNAIGEMIVA